jgi:transposase
MTDSTEAPRQRRRRYDEAFKRAIIEQTLAFGASVARIAREHGLNANLLFNWRRRYRQREQGQGASAAQTPSAISLLPVTVVADEAPAPARPAAPTCDGKLEIRLAGGTVRIEGVVDAATLQLILASLRR